MTATTYHPPTTHDLADVLHRPAASPRTGPTC